MATMSRRGALSATAALVASPSILRTSKARGAEFSFKYANNAPATHPLTLRPMEAAEAIAKETNGRVEIKIFPNNQLGGDTDMLAQLRSGALEFFTLSPLILSTLVPKASINGIGFAWPSYDEVWPAMDGDLGAFVRGEIEKGGLYAFEKIFDNGFRQITSSSKPIRTAEDLKGFKIRVPISPLWTSMFRAFDSSPLSINWAEVYSSLQTRIADGQENPVAIIEIGKIYEVQKYLSITNHMWDGFWFLTSQRFWSKIPAEVRQVVEKHVNQAAMRQREDMLTLNSTLTEKLAQRGMEVFRLDSAPFRAKLQSAGFYREWRDKFGPEAWALLEKHVGAIS